MEQINKTLNTPELIELCQKLLQQAKTQDVRNILKNINYKQVERKYLVDLANIARKAGRPLLALKILQPYINPEKSLIQPASTEEKLTYATALTNIGAIEEAEKFFKEINSITHPEKLLHQSFALFSLWEYKKSIPLLKRYIKSKNLSPFQVTVGKINLASAYVSTEMYDLADEVLNDLLLNSLVKSTPLMHASVLEILAQKTISQNNLSSARQHLKSSLEILGKSESVYNLFIKKWLCVIDLKSNGYTQRTEERLNQIKAEANEKRAWETVRDCDYHLALHQKNDDLFYNVYFGTNYFAYKKRILSKYPVDIPNRYIIGDANSTKLYDTLYKKDRHGFDLSKKPTLASLLDILISDRYKAFRIGELHLHMFPGESFNPNTSIHRVEQMIYRLRQEFQQSEVPLQIINVRGDYKLEFSASYGIIVYKKNKKIKDSRILELKKLWPYKSFTSLQAAKALNITRATALVSLKAAVEQGEVSMQGRGRSIRYFFKEK